MAPGPFEGEVLMRTDAFDGRFGLWGIGEIDRGIVLVELAHPVNRGDRLWVRGSVEGPSGMARGYAYSGALSVEETTSIEPSSFLPHVAGRAITRRVSTRLQPKEGSRALLAGFLIGDTSGVAEADHDAMRRAGLSHFTAVSGSNVALFLGLLAVAAGPLALGPRRRAVVGLIGLPMYAAATGFEPSVMRASLMAGIALGGRLIGLTLEAWQLLSSAVVLLVVAEPAIAANVGFQLSVVATAGVLVGSRWPIHNRRARALGVTLGAQAAVAPLLLVHFGSVPLMSPLLNIVAGPLVAAATVIGAVGVAGPSLLIEPASWLAGLVLTLARGSAGMPQLGFGMVLLVLAASLVATVLPRTKAALVSASALAVAYLLIAPGSVPPAGSVTVLDVGQGDSILVNGGGGHFMLVDGGPDPSVLVDHLRDLGVAHLDVVVLTHVHADHAAGLSGLVGHLSIGEVWFSGAPHRTGDADRFLELVSDAGVPVAAPVPGLGLSFGVLEVEVLGPERRYASPNDQSIVLKIQGPGRSMLLSGDIETFAQADLDGVTADVLKVPHQGAGTSDPEWLTSVGAQLAVISVGPNQFGHPVRWVVAALEGSGAEVVRTDQAGNVVVDLS